jgi:hypothetical protein
VWKTRPSVNRWPERPDYRLLSSFINGIKRLP